MIEDFPEADLFGHAHTRPQRGRGRPRFEPTEKNRERVSQLHSAGLTQLAIARELGITAPTLLLNFHTELHSTSQAWRRRLAKEKNNGTR